LENKKAPWEPQQPLEAAPNFHLNFLLPVKSGDLHHSNREVSKPDAKTCACFLKKMQNGHATRVYLRINTEPEEYHAKYFSGP
jgi:hypothetical protein